MDISMRKIGVLFKKDFIDFFKNMAVFVSCIMPLVLSLLYKYLLPSDLGMMGNYFLNMMICLNLAMVSIMLPATTIAEEKEKYTLRTLMLSNVSGVEVFTAKLLVTSLLLLITNTAIFFVFGEDPGILPMFTLILVFGAIAPILLGMAVGILARDQMNAGVYEIPVMLLFMLPVIFGNVNDTLGKIAEFTPCQPVLKLIASLQEGNLLTGDSLFRVAIVAVWAIGAAVILVLLYKKRGVDN